MFNNNLKDCQNFINNKKQTNLNNNKKKTLNNIYQIINLK